MPGTDYGTRVWAGDPTTVAEARERYETDPHAELIDFAVALYSFRNQARFAEELIGMRRALMDRADKIMCTPGPLSTEKSRLSLANEADVLATHLEWLSRQAMLDEQERERLRIKASNVCDYGVRLLQKTPPYRGHTLPLLYLTRARFEIDSNLTVAAEIDLERASALAWGIADQNQRARVYRKLGLLYRRLSGKRRKGLAWSIRALFVIRGTGWGTWLKSVAALLGVDR